AHVLLPAPSTHTHFTTPPPPTPVQSFPPGISMEGLEVHYLSSMEQEELLLQLLAAKNAFGDSSLGASSVDLSSEQVPGPAALPSELEENF
ncbi:hypothetical protein C0995_014448, partial [Termitomyces sp. Mi166